MEINKFNILVLAYMGDVIYETYIRKYLIDKGLSKVNLLQKNSVKYVSAKNQAKYLQVMINNNVINSFELDIVKRARNNKGSSHPKNTDIITYKWATGLEALIGYLYMENNITRIEEIIGYIIKNSEEE